MCWSWPRSLDLQLCCQQWCVRSCPGAWQRPGRAGRVGWLPKPRLGQGVSAAGVQGMFSLVLATQARPQGCTESCLQHLVLHTPAFLPIQVCFISSHPGLLRHLDGAPGGWAKPCCTSRTRPPFSSTLLFCPEMLPSCATRSLQGSREGNKKEASPRLFHPGALQVVFVQWGQGAAPANTSLTPSLQLGARWQSAKGLACLLRPAFVPKDQGLSWVHSTKLRCGGTCCGLLLEALH